MDVDLVTAWMIRCQELAPAFTRKALVTFVHVVAGWGVPSLLILRIKPSTGRRTCPPGAPRSSEAGSTALVLKRSLTACCTRSSS